MESNKPRITTRPVGTTRPTAPAKPAVKKPVPPTPKPKPYKPPTACEMIDALIAEGWSGVSPTAAEYINNKLKEIKAKL